MYQVFELQREAFDASVSKMANEYEKKYVPQAEGIEAWNIEIDKLAQTCDILTININTAIDEELRNCDKLDELFSYLKMYDHTPINDIRSVLKGIRATTELVLEDLSHVDKEYDNDDDDFNFLDNDRIKDDEVDSRHDVIKQAVDEVIGPVDTEALTEVVKEKNKAAIEAAQKAANEAKTEAEKAAQAAQAAKQRQAEAQAKVNEAYKELEKQKALLEQTAEAGGVVNAKELAQAYTDSVMSPTEIMKDAATLGIANSGAAIVGGATTKAVTGSGNISSWKTAVQRIKEQIGTMIKGTAKSGAGTRLGLNIGRVGAGLAKGYVAGAASQAALDLANNVIAKENAELVNKAIDMAADMIEKGATHDEAVKAVRDMLVEEDKKKYGGGVLGGFLSDVKAIVNAVKGDETASNAKNMAEAAVSTIEIEIAMEDAAAGVAAAQKAFDEAVAERNAAKQDTSSLTEAYEKAKQEADIRQAEADAIADSGAENSGGGEGNCDSSCDNAGCDTGGSCDSNPGCDSCTRDGCRRDSCDGGCDCDRDPACGKDGFCGSDTCKRETDD